MAHNNYGLSLASRRHVDEALAQYQKALAIRPDYVKARMNLGNAIARRGQLNSAIAQY